MAETRKLAAILAADIAGYSRLAAADEERTLARLRALRSDLIDPTIALQAGRQPNPIGGRGKNWRGSVGWLLGMTRVVFAITPCGVAGPGLHTCHSLDRAGH
jgi:class 3 adenylate cyclase